ncbi:hypothetical protein G5S35_17565 [Paraburkholderia tropica]|uniref:hypothetical protein n=1 Tax=Paraburkholderia tropica TaxID=92647 RepID=UPI001601466E|nr:hypothetical protein [Paraburkholderia tropica]QNB13438.1 hypothetical protein G5S35_17565 [Paraburkholderia tropica]
MATTEKLVEAIVARGRTIHDQQKAGEDPIIKKAGEKVKLPESEVARLRGLGFLVPEQVEEVSAEGVQISGGQSSVTRVE